MIPVSIDDQRNQNTRLVVRGSNEDEEWESKRKTDEAVNGCDVGGEGMSINLQTDDGGWACKEKWCIQKRRGRRERVEKWLPYSLLEWGLEEHNRNKPSKRIEMKVENEECQMSSFKLQKECKEKDKAEEKEEWVIVVNETSNKEQC